MPIRAELRKFYGPKWRRFRLELIEAAGGQICSKCRVELAERINGAHLDNDPLNPSSAVLMCPSCHASHDAKHRFAITRRKRAAAAGQAWLTEEIEWAPFLDWEIPPRVFDALQQLPLFQPGEVKL